MILLSSCKSQEIINEEGLTLKEDFVFETEKDDKIKFYDDYILKFYIHSDTFIVELIDYSGFIQTSIELDNLEGQANIASYYKEKLYILRQKNINNNTQTKSMEVYSIDGNLVEKVDLKNNTYSYEFEALNEKVFFTYDTDLIGKFFTKEDDVVAEISLDILSYRKLNDNRIVFHERVDNLSYLTVFDFDSNSIVNREKLEGISPKGIEVNSDSNEILIATENLILGSSFIDKFDFKEKHQLKNLKHNIRDLKLANGKYYVVIFDNTQKVVELQGDKNINYSNSQYSTIKISGISMPSIKDAAREYEKQNHNIKIELEDYSNDAETYVKRIGTELLSNQGPDIFECQFLELRDYVEKDMIVNIDQFITNDKDFDINIYNQGLINGLRINQKLYSFPIGYYIQTLVYDKTEIHKNLSERLKDSNLTWDEFLDISRQIQKNSDKGNKVIGNLDITEIGVAISKSYYNKIIKKSNGKIKVDKDELINALTIARAFYEEDLILEDLQQYSDVVFINADNIFSYSPLIHVKYIYKNNHMIIPFPSIDQQSDYRITAAYAINNNISEEKKKLAWDFIKFVASFDVQKKSAVFGFPINNEVLKSIRDEELEKENLVIQIDGTFIPVESLDESDIDMIDRILFRNVQSSRDGNIIRIIRREMASLTDLSKSTEDLADTIINKINLYLNERK